MPTRRLSALDQVVLRADRKLRAALGASAPAERPTPAARLPEGCLDAGERRHAAGLMRVNHAGEVAAQALYHAQSATARDHAVRESMRNAAREEADHLAWCEDRLRELGAGRSLLTPLWYGGSFAIGALAGLAGDRWSLGFVAETERQVGAHLEGHLSRLPESDARSRAVLEQMRTDEAQHEHDATEAGGADMPAPIRALMRFTGSIMTRTAYWL